MAHRARRFFSIFYMEVLPFLGARIQHPDDEDYWRGMHIMSRFNWYYRPLSGLGRLVLALTGQNLFLLSCSEDVKYFSRPFDRALIGDTSDMLKCAASLDLVTKSSDQFDPFGIFICRLVHV